MASNIGVIVCNHSRARLFKADTHSLVKELSDQVNPAARLRNQDLVTDGPGKYRGGGSGGQQHAEDPRTSPRDKAAENFARDIAAVIEEAVTYSCHPWRPRLTVRGTRRRHASSR